MMGSNSMRFRMFSLIFSIAFPVVIIVSLVSRNSSYGFFERIFKVQGGIGIAQNVTSTTNGVELKGIRQIQNVTGGSLGGKKDNNNYNVSGDVTVLQGETQNDNATEGSINNILTTDCGSKNASFASSTNDSVPQTGIPDERVKFIDGLLASGFGEASCISKVQSHLYRKISPHKASLYLIAKLRKYEEIHRRCGPYGSAYHKTMKNIVGSKKKSATAMCKYIIWTPANGLGNQMMSMAATFLYAILTGRVLLVKFGEDKHGLFCEPFLNSTWMLPEKSPFWKAEHMETYQIMLQKDRTNTSKKDLPSALYINLQHTHSDHEKFFHCDHTQVLLLKVPLLIMQSDQYFVPSLFMTPIFNLELTKMFPEKDTVFHHLGRYLFHPSNEAWRLISSFYEAHLAKADERVGLQIRVFSPDTTPHKAIMDLLLSCTIKHKILPQVSYQTSVSSIGKNQTVKAVFVSSLHQEYGHNLRSMYLNTETATGERIQVYQASHEEHQKFNDNKHNMRAWVDMYLLSLSDLLVTTSLSTFGYVAQGLGNLKPWLLYKLVKNETHFPPCERDFSLEPCYHTPPKHFCNGKPIKDFASSSPFLRECKDYCFGVKMVNASS